MIRRVALTGDVVGQRDDEIIRAQDRNGAVALIVTRRETNSARGPSCGKRRERRAIGRAGTGNVVDRINDGSGVHIGCCRKQKKKNSQPDGGTQWSAALRTAARRSISKGDKISQGMRKEISKSHKFQAQFFW